LQSQLFGLSLHRLAFHFLQFTLFDALNLALLNLVDDDQSAGALSFYALGDGNFFLLECT
jgi:hypothetical protein